MALTLDVFLTLCRLHYAFLVILSAVFPLRGLGGKPTEWEKHPGKPKAQPAKDPAEETTGKTPPRPRYMVAEASGW